MKAATFTHYKSSVIVRISIHAAREGGDIKDDAALEYITISIHAAREGGDCNGCGFNPRDRYFNPRRP